MLKLVTKLSIVNPAYGVAGVEFSAAENQKFRASNLRYRKTGTHVNVDGIT